LKKIFFSRGKFLTFTVCTLWGVKIHYYTKFGVLIPKIPKLCILIEIQLRRSEKNT